MKVAQSLYEKGLITYMRTDSVALSEEFCAAAKAWLEEKDPQNVPEKQRKHRKGKNSQEAHEAIRPSNLNYPSVKLKQEISEAEFNLYLLIWKRAIASSCRPALIDKTVVVSQSASVFWKAKGQMVKFMGYARYWNNLSADSQLPDLSEEQTLQLAKADLEKKRTSPPSRYGEPQLVALMEKKESQALSLNILVLFVGSNLKSTYILKTHRRRSCFGVLTLKLETNPTIRPQFTF